MALWLHSVIDVEDVGVELLHEDSDRRGIGVDDDVDVACHPWLTMEGAREGTRHHVFDSSCIQRFDDLGEKFVLHLGSLGCALADEERREFAMEHLEPRHVDFALAQVGVSSTDAVNGDLLRLFGYLGGEQDFVGARLVRLEVDLPSAGLFAGVG